MSIFKFTILMAVSLVFGLGLTGAEITPTVKVKPAADKEKDVNLVPKIRRSWHSVR